MRKQLALTALLAAATALPVQAQSQSALEQIRADLKQLSERVGKVEAENQQLKQENAELKEKNDELEATTEYLRSNTSATRKQMAQDAVKIEKADALVKGAEWASKVAVKGDLRYRHEQIMDDTVNGGGVQTTADRYRDRVRARVAIEGKPTDKITVGIGMATTEGGDPRSSNQSLDGTFSRKSLDLDLAYADWKFASWGNLIGGKMKQPFVKPGQSLFWDNDINPEGLAFNYNNGMLFSTAYYYWIDEVSGAENTQTADAGLGGLQIGARIPLGANTLVLGAHYYDLMAGQGRRGVMFNGVSNGNTTVGPAATAVLANDFEVLEAFAEFNMMLGTLPFQVWAEIAENRAIDDLNRALGGGFVLGKASNPKTWELGLFYQKLEKDSLFAQLVDSDFGAGLTDTKGYVLKAGFAPVKNWTLNATYFKNKLNMDVGNAIGATDVNYDRLQLDVNFKF